MAQEHSVFLITSNNILIALIYELIIKKATNNKCILKVLLYLDYDNEVNFNSLLPYINSAFDDVDIITYNEILTKGEKIINDYSCDFDFCINCSDTNESEIIDVLGLRKGGTLFCSNVARNYQTSLFFAEGIGKNITITGPLGYIDGYNEFTKNFMEEISDTVLTLAEGMRDAKVFRCSCYDEFKIARQSIKYNNIAALHDFVYASDLMAEVVRNAINIAKFDCNVLITGKTGVGKELVTKLIHEFSNRKSEPCISVNCSAIPENLVEMEFFGYERGAFTGANSHGAKGYFEIAGNGILVLDEIGELSISMQSKLLRVLQNKEFYRVGGEKAIASRARVIASTNRNLREMVEHGMFREDLFYRLLVASIHVPSLVERKEDIEPITAFFVEKYNKELNMMKEFDYSAFSKLYKYDWPGNIRELENLILRAMINSSTDIISDIDIERELQRNNGIEKDSGNMVENNNNVIQCDYECLSFDDFIYNMEKNISRVA